MYKHSNFNYENFDNVEINLSTNFISNIQINTTMVFNTRVLINLKIEKDSYWPNELSVCQWSGRLGFNPRLSHTKDSKMVLNVAFLNTQYHKVKGKVEQSREWSSVLPYTSVQ